MDYSKWSREKLEIRIAELEKELECAKNAIAKSQHLNSLVEISSSAMHNIGNILNSVNIAVESMKTCSDNSKIFKLARIPELVQDFDQEFNEIFLKNDRFRKLIQYIVGVTDRLIDENKKCKNGLCELHDQIQHAVRVIDIQQSYARVGSLDEFVQIDDVIIDAIKINAQGLQRHGVKLLTDLQPIPPIKLDRHKTLHILTNLISNAKYALEQSSEKQVLIKTKMSDDGKLCISIIDTGVGILAENLSKLFTYGFTTRKSGHGIGLYNSLCSAKEMKGCLRVHSEGIGKGAEFILELPAQFEEIEKKEAA